MDSPAGTDRSHTTLVRHVAETLSIGVPLAAAQLAQMAMEVTDAVLLGRLGPEALGAGGLSGSIFFSLFVVLQGVVAAVGVLVAQAIGARQPGRTPKLFWSGLCLAVALGALAFAVLSFAEPILLRLGQPPRLAHDVGQFLAVLRWAAPGTMIGLGLFRAFLPAIGAGWLILPVTFAGMIVNGVLAYALIHGAFGLPRLGMNGAALATAVVQTGMATALFLATIADRRRRRLLGWAWPGKAALAAQIRLGVPIAATFAVETGMFLAVSLLAGQFGAVALAGHQVALNVTALAFMIPLGIAQAANVRVGHRVGANQRAEARRAGLIAIALGAAAEAVCALPNLLVPADVARLFLGTEAAQAIAGAAVLLRVAAVFQIVDGMQCVAAGALRGLGDAQIPFLLAAAGYWGLGVPAAWLFGVGFGWGVVGGWWGLAVGLTAVALLLTFRFALRSARPVRPAFA